MWGQSVWVPKAGCLVPPITVCGTWLNYPLPPQKNPVSSFVKSSTKRLLPRVVRVREEIHTKRRAWPLAYKW